MDRIPRYIRTYLYLLPFTYDILTQSSSDCVRSYDALHSTDFMSSVRRSYNSKTPQDYILGYRNKTYSVLLSNEEMERMVKEHDMNSYTDKDDDRLRKT